MNNRKNSTDKEDDYIEDEFTVEIPGGFECPITTDIMVDPVIASDGHSYEEAAIKQWLTGGRRVSPMTGEKLAHTLLTPNHALRKAIQAFLKQRPGLAAIKKEIHAQRSLDQQMQDLLLAIKLREEDLAAQSAKKPKELRQSALEAVDEKQQEVDQWLVQQTPFGSNPQPGVIEKITSIAQKRCHPRTQISDALLKAIQREVALDNLREENAANKIKRFYLKFGKMGLKSWMKASHLYERQTSLSRQLEQSIEKQIKKAEIFNLELDQQANVDIKALETMRGEYETKIKEATSVRAWEKLAVLAQEAERAQQALQITQQQIIEAKIEAFQQTGQQCEANQLRLRQELNQIALEKAEKQRDLLQRVIPIAKLTAALHANEIQRAGFLEDQDKLLTLLKEQANMQHITELYKLLVPASASVLRLRKASFFKFEEEKHVPNLYQIQVEKFIKLVTDGQQDEAEALLKAEPLLALTYGKVIDNVGRPIQRITAFQYALFVLDAHMWNMMVTYFTDEHCQLAYEQLNELEIHGIEYGKEQNWTRLTDEMKKYSDNYARWSYEECVQQLKVIGEEQDKLAQHVVSEYNQPDRPFSPVPNFENREKLRRGSGREKEWKNRKGQFWMWTRGKDPKISSQNYNISIISFLTTKYYTGLKHLLDQDGEALLELSRIRYQQKDKLRQRLREKSLPQLAGRKVPFQKNNVR